MSRSARLVSLGCALAGTGAATGVLRRRDGWERSNRTVSVCVDHDDLVAAAIRSGWGVHGLLEAFADRGATHVSVPELTLDRLMRWGRLAPSAVPPIDDRPDPVGHWSALVGEPALIEHLATELVERVPHSQAHAHEGTTLVFAGAVPPLAALGLGFDASMVTAIAAAGLGAVARPVSYPWPERALIDRTIAQAVAVGPIIAFEGTLILGHELHLAETLAALQRDDAVFAYFGESRHQKGDWFLAKELGDRVVLAHGLTRQELADLDIATACEHWVWAARELSTRLCHLHLPTVLHATDPLEGLDYVAMLREALGAEGYTVGPACAPTHPRPATEPREAHLLGLGAGAIAGRGLAAALGLSGRSSLAASVVGAVGAAALPLVDRAGSGRPHSHSHDHGHSSSPAEHADHDAGQARTHPHEHDRGTHVGDGPAVTQGPASDHGHAHHGHAHHDHTHHDHAHHGHAHPPPPATAYASKAIALGAVSMGPLLALDERASWPERVLGPAAAGVIAAAATSGPDYLGGTEDFRGLGLDWLIPAIGVATGLRDARHRQVALVALTGAWLASGRQDLLARLDRRFPEGHSHHVSSARVAVGDAGRLLGPRPARKWAGLLPAAAAASRSTTQPARAVADGVAVLGSVLGLVGTRVPLRDLRATVAETGPGLLAGSLAGAAVLALGRLRRRTASV